MNWRKQEESWELSFFLFPRKVSLSSPKTCREPRQKKYKSQVLEVQFKVFTLNCLVPTHARWKKTKNSPREVGLSRAARGFGSSREVTWTHHCAPIRADEGRIGSVAASLVSSATCWLAHRQAKNTKKWLQNPLKNYVNRAHPPRMCPVMIINNALRLIIQGGLREGRGGFFERRLAPRQPPSYSNEVSLIN